ncbi:hypothetical protein EV356DRAFT_576776 [Viridothelium virens]|uniref:Uncharacterized protein n=1 Tax=Viridothelium virens TaxID=1048519 RepID=A0A6A6H883_VIRVR|nr:hypothetical protein EV356DRAFT_576776 [Viridothelium virens]
MAPEPQSYFVPGYGISRYVIQSQIRYYCGPGAFARPYTLQGRDGFLVTTSGPPLTKEQLEDIREASRAYEEQLAARANEAAENPNQPIVVEHSQRDRRRTSG